MKKKQITTSRLNDILKNVKTPEDIQEYMDKYGKSFYSDFPEYFNAYMAEKDLTVSEVVLNSNVSVNYVYNILNGKRNPGRNKVLALCIGAGMTCEEINRALEIAHLGILYPKDPRDARITVEINKGVKNITELNLLLEEAGLEIIK